MPKDKWKEWRELPTTQEFLKGLHEKAEGIRFSWFLGHPQRTEDRAYCDVVEDILRGQDFSVEYDAKEVKRAAKEHGLGLTGY